MYPLCYPLPPTCDTSGGCRYDKHKFSFTLTLPPDYPFKPPKVKFTPAIYHPNFSDGGEPCLTIINPDKWKPATKIAMIFPALLSMVEEAQLDHPQRADLAEMYVSLLRLNMVLLYPLRVI
jgi:ubiquitin-protein ligase